MHVSTLTPVRRRILVASLLPLCFWAVPAHADFHLASMDELLRQDPYSDIDPLSSESSGGSVYGGIGLDVIDGDTWISVSLRPELSFGNLGLGLYIPLRFSTSNGEIRDQDWDTTTDYLAVFRYVRWAHKGDPFYVRVGVQDNATIGHGSIMRHYANTLDEDNRKAGFVLDLNQGAWGIESIYSNFARAEIMGGRAYYRPFYNTAPIPVLRTFAIGATVVSDVDPNPYASGDAAVVYGFDLDLPILRRSTFDLTLYYDHARIRDYGSGNIVGATDVIRFPLQSLSLTTRLERRFLNDEFVAPYFGHFYERDRATRLDEMDGLESESGWFGEAMLNILNTFYVQASYEWKDDDPDGWLHAETGLPTLIPSIQLTASYDRYHINEFQDVSDLDDDSHLRCEAKYRLNSMFWLVGSFHRTWMLADEAEWATPGIPEYEPTDRTAVRIELAIPLSIE